ncbi:MAG: hypothetical protein Kow0074_20590 [Candidatus Zixiibacteriota bacterium]
MGEVKGERGVRHEFRWTCALLILCAGLAVGLSSAEGAEPLTPLMETLGEVFPQGKGWFLEGPLGAAPGTPENAVPYFEQPRVVLPNVDAVQPALGRLYAASSRLPLRKVHRYDEKPNAKGLPGFRGIWCETEDETQVGFAILTPNQNRFLIWARDAFYPAFQVDSIEPKVRDWYARSVSEYLASLELGVPGSYPPKAEERLLPEWFDLYPPAPKPVIADDQRYIEFLLLQSEIRFWDWSGIVAFVPTNETLNRLITSAPDSVFSNDEPFLIQEQFRKWQAEGGRAVRVNDLTKAGFDTLAAGEYMFAVDRFGRIRIARGGEPGQPGKYVQSHALLFPGSDVLAAGWMGIRQRERVNIIHSVDAFSKTYFYSPYRETIRTDMTDRSNEYSLTLGHFFESLKTLGISTEGVLIRKF